MQPDPVGYEGGANLYAYVANDPVNLSDPLGLTPTQLICTGTRICPQHDSGGSGGSGGAGGGKDTSSGKERGDSGSRDTTVAQLFGYRSWGGFGSGRYQCVQRCGYPSTGVAEGNGDVGIYAPAQYEWVGIDASVQLASNQLDRLSRPQQCVAAGHLCLQINPSGPESRKQCKALETTCACRRETKKIWTSQR